MTTDQGKFNFAASVLLRIGFTVAPIIAGFDKFTNVLASWGMYLSPVVAKMLPVPAGVFMRTAGVVEIIAGVIVALKPKIGGLIVSIWLSCIIINLLTYGMYYDIALRDLGLAIGALSLSLLNWQCGCKAKA